MTNQENLRAGERLFEEPQTLRTSFGPLNFAGAARAVAVDWYEKGKLDLLVGGTKGIIWLYERIGGTPEQPKFAPPVEVGKIPSYISIPIVFDWNRDGKKDLLVAGRDSLIYLLENVGTNTAPQLEFAGPLRDDEGLPFSIEYHHPLHEFSDENGYLDERFSNYLSPFVCDWFADGGDDILIGDNTGVIWILEDISQGDGLPRYRGERYQKQPRKRVEGSGVRTSPFTTEYGDYFSRPVRRLNYADGTEIRLGIGREMDKTFAGCMAKPVVFDWNGNGQQDLLIAAGDVGGEIEYLENIGRDSSGAPLLVRRGPLLADGNPVKTDFHNSITVVDWDGDGRQDLIATTWSNVVYYHNRGISSERPVLSKKGVFSVADAPLAAGYIAGAVDWNGNGLPDLLEGSWEGFVHIRENTGTLKTPQFSSNTILLHDTEGPIRLYGETDIKQRRHGGVSKPVMVDWNNDGTLDLIVGGDTGQIVYFQGVCSGRGAVPKTFLKGKRVCDSSGNAIKVHNRVAPTVLDITGNGRPDLLVAGATYQMGHDTDPHVGGDIQLFENVGTADDGSPILAPGKIFEIDGKPFTFDPNQNCRMQSGDIDGDGKIEIVLFVNFLRTRVIRNIGSPGAYRWVFAEELPGGWEFGGLADITGNGRPDAVFGGGEYTAGHFRLNRT